MLTSLLFSLKTSLKMFVHSGLSAVYSQYSVLTSQYCVLTAQYSVLTTVRDKAVFLLFLVRMIFSPLWKKIAITCYSFVQITC